MNGKNSSTVVPMDRVPPADTSAYRPVVLVVDDESAVADTLTEILSRSGYTAMTAYDGPGARAARQDRQWRRHRQHTLESTGRRRA